MDGGNYILAAFPGAPSADSKAETLFESKQDITTNDKRLMAQKPADTWAATSENFGKLKVGMTLKEVNAVLGVGPRLAKDTSVRSYWDWGLAVGAPGKKLAVAEEAKRDTWVKAVKEERVHQWQETGNSGILAAFFEVPSDDTKVEAFFYWTRNGGYTQKGSIGALTKDGKRAGLAIEFVTMSKSYADKWGLPNKGQPQLAVVHAGGGGARLGLERDDVLLRVNSRDVLTWKQADTALRLLTAGAPVELVVSRAGKERNLMGPNATEFSEAEEWPRLLALAASDPRVQGIVGYRYSVGVGVPKNDAEAVKWFRKAADAGDVRAQSNLGKLYETGRGLPKNEEEALQWYRKAAKQDYARAQYDVGWMYEQGLGVAKDLKQAVVWYKKAAEQDYPSAQSELGWMFANGLGVPKNEAEAVKWYKKAIVRDDATAQNNLGWMYEQGLGGLPQAFGQGTKEGIAEAVRLYRLAAEQGNQFAKDNLKRLGK
jgi:hypothetical protein